MTKDSPLVPTQILPRLLWARTGTLQAARAGARVPDLQEHQRGAIGKPTRKTAKWQQQKKQQSNTYLPMTSQSSYTSSKRMSSSAIVRPRLGKNYPPPTPPPKEKEMRPKPQFMFLKGVLRADDSVRNNWQNAARVASSRVSRERVAKKGFQIPVVASFVDPPVPASPQKIKIPRCEWTGTGKSCVFQGSAPPFPVSCPPVSKSKPHRVVKQHSKLLHQRDNPRNDADMVTVFSVVLTEGETSR